MQILIASAIAASLVAVADTAVTQPTASTEATPKKVVAQPKPVKLPPVCDGLEKKHEGKILVIDLKDADGNAGGRTCAFVDATPEEVYGALVDYESFPRWMDKVEAIKVDWKDETTAHVAYEVGTFIGSFDYLLERKHYPFERVRWKMLEGDLDMIVGGYDFFPVDGGTVMILESFIDPGVYMPGFIESHFREKGARRVIQDVRDETKRRQGSQ